MLMNKFSSDKTNNDCQSLLNLDNFRAIVQFTDLNNCLESSSGLALK